MSTVSTTRRMIPVVFAAIALTAGACAPTPESVQLADPASKAQASGTATDVAVAPRPMQETARRAPTRRIWIATIKQWL